MRSLENFEKLTASTLNNKMIETEIEFKSKLFSKGLTDTIHSIANEPSLGFYRIEEHVHKSIQTLINKKTEIDAINDKLKGTQFDLIYAIDATKRISNSDKTFDAINKLFTDSLYLTRQINIKNNNNNNNNNSSNSGALASGALNNIINSVIDSKQQSSDNNNSSKKDTPTSSSSIFSSFLSKPFRTSSVSVSENLNQEQRVPQRSQTMLINSTINTNEQQQQQSKLTNETIIEETK